MLWSYLFNNEVADRAHRVGKDYMDKISKRKVKSITVKFKLWKTSQKLHNTRPWVQKDGKKKPFQIFIISVDLTRRRYQLLSEARKIGKYINAIKFVFVNINCSLGVGYDNGSFSYFNSKQELHDIIYKFNECFDINTIRTIKWWLRLHFIT